MDFIEERLLDKVAYGTQSGVEYNTRIVTMRSGYERRAKLWSRPLTRFAVIYRALRPHDREHVVRVFRAVGGRFMGFRMRDPLDYTATNDPLGVSEGGEQTLQLIKTYPFGVLTETAPVFKPVPGTIKLYADGDEIPAAVDNTTGMVTFTAAAGLPITWSGQFDKPVRFDDDQLLWSLDARSGAFGERIASSDISLTEIRV